MAKRKIAQKKTERVIVKEIRDLHKSILSSCKISIGKAIKIGKLLKEQKKLLKHGQWQSWIKKNLPLTSRTATNYMKIHAKRDI